MQSEPGAADADVRAFNALPVAAARAALLACCASPAWAEAVLAGRPYPDAGALLDSAAARVTALPWPEVERALAAHPRIGERPAGDGREAGYSRREQAGLAGAGDAVRAAIAAGNAEYEQRFGHVYLVRAAGRSAEELLALLRVRLRDDPAVERDAVRRELADITRIRLRGVLS